MTTPSLNEAMISGPAYLNSLEGILYRWRSAFSVAHGDIKHCYHQVKSAPQDMSYRGVFIRNEGMGSQSEWQEACFASVSFGDILGGPVAQLAMDDCFNKFITEEKVKSAIRENTYMDDVSILNNDLDVPIQSIVRTVDGALAQGSFKINHWVCAGDTETVKFLSYHYEAHTNTFCVKPVINWTPRHRGARTSLGHHYSRRLG